MSRRLSTYEEENGAGFRAPRLIVIATIVAAIGSTVYGLRMDSSQPAHRSVPSPEMLAVETPLPTATATLWEPPATSTAVPTPIPTPVPTFTPATPLPRVLIVAGHWGHDTGAVCPDGLREVDINLDVARRVLTLLESRGYSAELMEEFDPRLEGYYALALVSIHADSCEPFPGAVPPATGFKVASVTKSESRVPEAESRLVNCLVQEYAARTGLYFHENSVTPDMTRYHVFYEIDARTPAAIIETGFMYSDRQLLTQGVDRVAQGIADGIVCFLESEAKPQ